MIRYKGYEIKERQIFFPDEPFETQIEIWKGEELVASLLKYQGDEFDYDYKTYRSEEEIIATAMNLINDFVEHGKHEQLN